MARLRKDQSREVAYHDSLVVTEKEESGRAPAASVSFLPQCRKDTHAMVMISEAMRPVNISLVPIVSASVGWQGLKEVSIRVSLYAGQSSYMMIILILKLKHVTMRIISVRATGSYTACMQYRAVLEMEAEGSNPYIPHYWHRDGDSSCLKNRVRRSRREVIFATSLRSFGELEDIFRASQLMNIARTEDNTT